VGAEPVSFAEKDPFRGIPFPGPCCKREKEEKDTKSNDAAYLFERGHYGEGEASPASLAKGAACPAAELMRSRRVVRGAGVARARAVRGTRHGRAVFTPWDRALPLSQEGT
jgi:hypothetical protein